MQYKQAQAVLSDFLLKCEDEGVALPADPLDAVVAAVRALSHEAKHEVGRPQMEAAMAAMRQQFGAAKQSTQTPRPRKSSATDKTVDVDNDEHDANDSPSPLPSPSPPPPPPPPRKRAAAATKNKSRLHSEVLAKQARRNENQPLVDQLVQLGEFERERGHTQRGVAHMRAAKQLRDADDVIMSGAQARQLDRVGPSAATKIDAILHGGLAHAMREYE